MSSLENDELDSAGNASNPARAFSLMELLVVVAIIGMLMALVLPSLQFALKANSISGGGQLVADQLTFARQEAITKNGDVETRLYKFDDPNDASPNEVMRALQSFRLKADGTREPLGRLVRLPTGATISTNAALSGVFGQMSFQTPGPQDPNLAGVGKNYSWLGFLFHADGSMNLPQDPGSRTNNFVTIVGSTDQAAVPANYYSIMIESRSGRIKVYRP
ncbi:MAG: Verru_Chthon cassette protein D [Verrucomicrobiota bacterium]